MWGQVEDLSLFYTDLICPPSEWSFLNPSHASNPSLSVSNWNHCPCAYCKAIFNSWNYDCKRLPEFFSEQMCTGQMSVDPSAACPATNQLTRICHSFQANTLYSSTLQLFDFRAQFPVSGAPNPSPSISYTCSSLYQPNQILILLAFAKNPHHTFFGT